MARLIDAPAQLGAYTPEQYSAFGSMLGGFGAILAVVGAAALLLVEIRGRREEAARYADERRQQAQERREQDDRHRDEIARQARLVIAEMGKSIDNPEDPSSGKLFMYIDVTNHSDAFVFDVVVRIPGNDQRKLLHYIAPGSMEEAEFRYIPNDYYVRNVGCGGPYTPYQLRVTLEFTDASGRRWRRSGWDQPRLLPVELAESDLYRSLPPVPIEGHPYDQALASLAPLFPIAGHEDGP